MMDISNCFYNILSFTTVLSYLILFKYILDNFNCKKFNNRINYTIIIFIAIFIFGFELENEIIFILISTIFYKINYEQSILKCFLISLIYWFFVYIPIENISVYLAFNINYNDLTENFYTDSIIVEIECMIIENIFMMVIAKISNQTVKLKNIKNTYKRVTYIVICTPIIINILILIIAFRIIAIDKFLINYCIMILIAIAISTLIYNVCTFYIIRKSIDSYKLDYENKVIKDNILKEYNYYLDINKEKDKVRSLYHDMKNHIICIRHLCEEKDRNKVLEYIDSLEDNIGNYNKLNEESYTGNMILDSILRVKKSICIEKNIDFFVDMDFAKSDFIAMVDVCTIFSNLVDNAIEACDKVNSSNVSKKIILKSKYIDRFCIILIENTKTNEIKQEKNLFLTNKKNSYMHGIGLNNVRSTVEKYFGELIVSHSENIFTVKIMIPYHDI